MQVGTLGGLVDRFIALAGNSRGLGRHAERVTNALLPTEMASATDGCDCPPDGGFCSGTDCGGYGVWVQEIWTCVGGVCRYRQRGTGICC